MANRFWAAPADANWADANVWATTDGGDPTGVATPTQNDDCFFTATNSHKCTIGATANCNNLYFDNADNGGNGDYVGTLAGASFLYVYGNLVLSSGMTNNHSTNIFMAASSGSVNITTNTKNINYLNCTGAATFVLTDNLNIGNSTIGGQFIFSGAGNFSSGANTIKYVNTQNGAVTFAGGSKTYNNIYFSRGASTGSITITGANTFNDFKDDGTAAHSILFTKSTTQNIATWNVNGAGGGVRTILDTADGLGTFTLHGTGTTLSCYWLDIRRSTVDASPAWYAGVNSLNTASNTNWIFSAGPIIYTMVTAPASFSYTPQSSGDPVTRFMTTAKATFTLTGMASGFQTIRKMITAPASYVLTGMASGFQTIRKMITAPASYVLTGMASGFQTIRKMITAPASYVLTGMASGFQTIRKMITAPASYVLTGMSAGMKRILTMIASSTTYSLNTQAVTFNKVYKMVTSVASYILTGMKAGITAPIHSIWIQKVVSAVTNWTGKNQGQ